MASRPAPAAPRRPRKNQVQSVSDGRHAALEVVLLLEQGAMVQSALDSYLRGASLKPQDRALCTELVYGFLRAEIRIDHLLQGLLRNPAKLPREMYLALGLALYALVFLERIPPHATVDWTVGHVRRRFGEAMSRVANGTLRTFVRLGDGPKQLSHYCPHGASPAAALYAEALYYSLPSWVVKLWDKAYGPDARMALCQRSLRAPYTGVRVNALSPHASVLYAALLHPEACHQDKEQDAADCAKPSLRHSAADAEKTEPPTLLPCAHAVGFCGAAFAPGRSPRSVANAPLSYWQQQGDISFQSAGSQCVIEALQPSTWPGPVWDICAGQGGKTSILMEQGVVVALCSDVHVERLESFTRNMQRLASAFGVKFDTDAACASGDEASLQATPPRPDHCLAAATACKTSVKCLPDTALYTAACVQAFEIVDRVTKTVGIAVPVLPYPAPVGKKHGPNNDPDYYYDADEDVADADSPDADVPDADSADAMSVSHADCADNSICDQNTAQTPGPAFGSPAEQCAEQCAGQVFEGRSSLNPYSAAPACLPVVALMDGCLAPVNSWAGTICIDAPCSGLGILNRRPDIRRSQSQENIAELIEMQSRLLDAAWLALQVGGGLVYVTCTLNPAENEHQIERLLQKYSDARLVRQWQADHQHPWLEGMFGAYCVKV